MGQHLWCQYQSTISSRIGDLEVENEEEGTNGVELPKKFQSPKRKIVVQTSINRSFRTFEKYLESFHSNNNIINTINMIGNNDSIGINKNNSIFPEETKQTDIFKELEGNKVSIISKEIDENGKTNILNTLSSHFLFKDITDDLMELIMNKLKMYQFESNSILYKEDIEGAYFYILVEGQLEASSKGTLTRLINPWTCFGEISLMHESKREETIVCLTNVVLYALEGTSFRNIQKQINDTRLKDRLDFLNAVPLFKHLDSISKINIIEMIEVVAYHQKDKIITIGELGDKMFVIKEGAVSCRIGKKEIRKCFSKDFFGQNAILINTQRTCDVYADSDTICYEISISSLQKALGVNYKRIILFGLFKHYFNSHKVLNEIFIESLMEELFKCFYLRIYNQTDMIYQPNLSEQRIIMIIEGSILNKTILKIIAKKGDILGEELFKKPEIKASKDIIAYPDLISLEADLSSITKILKLSTSNPVKPFHLLKRMNNLRSINIFSSLSDQTLESIASLMKKNKYKPNQVIIEEDIFGDDFYLITEGRVCISQKGKYVRNLEKGSCFGEIALISRQENRTATVTAIDNVTCYILSKENFEKINKDSTISKYLQKKLSLRNTSISLFDLYHIKFLGKGKYGSVHLVHNKQNIYAIKAISHNKDDQSQLQSKYLLNERTIMQSIDHPFIVKLVKVMQNNSFFFYLLEYVNGKNMNEYLSTRKTKRNYEETRFYIASLLIMVDYLQKKKIVHRDIKPSNIMIDSNGYLKLIDFGTARIINDYTTTVIGTPYYIAPEILLGKGYSFSCDYWSVGICMYEIFYGIYPFGSNSFNIIDIYKEITHKKLVIKDEFSSYDKVNHLIKNLLRKQVNQRPCNLSILKAYSLFTNFDWNKLIDFRLQSPYNPKGFHWEPHLNNNPIPFESIINQNKLKSFGSI